MTLIWIRIRKAAMCGRVPRETQKKPLWLPHRPHTNKHWLQTTTQTDHKCAGAGAVLCLSSRRNTLVGGLLDLRLEPERAALKEEHFSQRPQSRLQFCASFSASGCNMPTKWQSRRFYTSWIYNKLVPCLCLCVSGLFQSQSSTDSYISALHSPILCQFISYIQTFVSCVLELFALIHVCSPTYVRIASHLWLEARSSPAPP